MSVARDGGSGAIGPLAVLIGLVVLWEVLSRTVLAGQYVLAGPVAIILRVI